MAKSVLIIEDDISLRNALRDIFQDMNYEVYVACNGKQDQAPHCRTAPDIIVTDIYMPGKDDLETIREIRKEFPEVKIIVMSGIYKGKCDFFQVFRYLGAIACLRKPFESEPYDIISIVNLPLDGNAPENTA